MEIGDGSVAKFAEVMGQDLCGQSDGDAFSALRQHQRELHGQRDRLFVSSVVRHFPVCRLGIEHRIQGELRQSGLDISWCCCARSCEDVTPVTLCVDEQILLSHLHQGVANTGVAMRVELHRVSHDVRHLIISSVVHALHRVQDASLHGFQTVLDMGNGTVEDAITGIIEEPILIHAAQMVHCSGIEAVYGLIVGVAFLGLFRLLLFQDLVVLYLVVHGLYGS